MSGNMRFASKTGCKRRKFALLASQIEGVAQFAVWIGDEMRIGGGRRFLDHVGLLRRQFPRAATIGVAVFGLVIFTVGLADAGGFFRLQIAVELRLGGG
jgi:hypothetical protein